MNTQWRQRELGAKSDLGLPMDAQKQWALEHPRRTEILAYLMQKGEIGTNENELANSLGLTPVKVKYHLMVLRGADLI